VQENLDDRREADPFGHEQLNESQQFLGQHHKTQGSDADEERRQQFRKNVAIEDFIQKKDPGGTLQHAL
jgi:hypothetical protein